MSSSRTRIWSLGEVRWAAAAVALFATGLAAQLSGAPVWLWWTLYLACYAAGGWEPALEGLRALRDRKLDVDLLMVAAAVGAAAIGQVTDGALLIVIFATSGALESLATARTEDSVRSLLDLAPPTATRLPDEEVVATADLRVGEVILVRPGERIGADGRVLDGSSDVDQATITGEGMPVPKHAGDEVFAGTLNGTGVLRVEVIRDPADSVIARIVAMVEQAAATKAPTQLFIERIEQRYSIGMVVATLGLFAVPLAFGAELSETLLRAMTFMIVASPCAVVLATMPPMLAAIANAGRHGVLIKSAVVLERLAQVDAVALDKSGTLTEGTPHLTDVRPLPGSGLDDNALVSLAASVEHASEHPIARAIVTAAGERGLPSGTATAFTATPGSGVRAQLDGVTVTVGSPARLLPGYENPDGHGRTSEQPGSSSERAAEDLRAGSEEPEALVTSPKQRTEGLGVRSEREEEGLRLSSEGEPRRVAALRVCAELERAGRTAVVVLTDGVPVGVLAVTDRLRDDAAAATAGLTALTGAAPVLLTGDNPRAAADVAAQVGITDVRAQLLPEDKVAAVRQLQDTGRRMLMIGDGVNDAPALATAHVGLAMGRAGSDLAVQSADAVIVRDELSAVPAALALARRARRLVVQNLVIAGAFITVLVVWDLVGHLPLPLGVAGHEGSTVLVGLNGLRLLRRAAWNRASNPCASDAR
ncbi:hypothetical protein GCM10010404_09440 [Nonomuraea africana]|uniref:Heavy metal-(Cd/Co/Hg/Pb/Zn)-translocating P-type ATPase n=1 Tax=Nonomuraea africana TaxID=46171 RepID=A0ABR9KJV9_9ACTN|nr:HAD-IC family P-type ATPase [Nonomuraea africana]MBE1562313.1 heavy metal-(Cd/Co/Hg/Pb/Zn)-translocating P-type ATPase [Nonomuraea africana]